MDGGDTYASARQTTTRRVREHLVNGLLDLEKEKFPPPQPPEPVTPESVDQPEVPQRPRLTVLTSSPEPPAETSSREPTELRVIRPRSEKLTAIVEDFAGVISKQCSDEWEALRLASDRPISVRWSLIEPEFTDTASKVFDSEKSQNFDVRSDEPEALVGKFLGLSRQRLVVLGEAGAGKTVLALALQRQLLREQSWKVPILLPASSWDIDKFPRLDDWMAHRLRNDFPDIAEDATLSQIVNQNLIFPILDGLDEVEPDALPKLWAALRTQLSGNDALVLTCRSNVFIRLVTESDVLENAAVIEAQAVTPSDGIAYLNGAMTDRQRPRWAQ